MSFYHQIAIATPFFMFSFEERLESMNLATSALAILPAAPATCITHVKSVHISRVCSLT